MSEKEIPKVQINIDGQNLDVPQGCMIIEAADNAGIRIPRFCYHKKLSIAANCRMCLVDVEGARRPAPACATPVTAGMKVLTKSPKALEFQKSVMEFLLINHPLDCPICDQGGECELQDNAMGYGKDVSRYNEGKRVVKDKDIGPLISTDLTRCIHCTRCVRFGVEIAGMQELGMTGRGENSMIATFLQNGVDSEMSGNVIDLCPVGALTSKPFRYKARAWELQQFSTIAPHDCIGSNIYAHVRRGETMRVVPKENENLNEVWISDRDRYSYEGINVSDRALKPMIKKHDQWETLDWSTALEFAATTLKHVKDHQGAASIGALANSSSTTEEYVLLHKLIRALGSHNIDHRLRASDFRHEDWQAAFPKMEMNLADIETADAILYVGGNVRKEQPILHHRMRKGYLQNGVKIALINVADFGFLFEPMVNTIVDSIDMVRSLASVAKAMLETQNNVSVSKEVTELLSQVDITEDARQTADILLASKQPILLMGEIATHHHQASIIFALLQFIKSLTQGRFGQLTTGANAAGAWLAGVLPHRGMAATDMTIKGLNAHEMLDPNNALKAYVLLNVEPDVDTAYGQNTMNALQKADFVIALTPYVSESIKEVATVILPIAGFTETSGTFINAFGDWQSFTAVAKALGESRPAWKVLRVLANFLGLFGFEYDSSEEVLNELKRSVRAMINLDAQCKLPASLPHTQNQLMSVGFVPLYASDNLVRRAKSLQATDDAKEQASVYLSKALAEKHHLTDGQSVKIEQAGNGVILPVCVQEKMAAHTILIPMGIPETAALGNVFGTVSLAKVKE